MKILPNITALILVVQAAVFGLSNYNVTITEVPPVIDGNITTGWEDAFTFTMVYPDIVNEGGTLRGDVPSAAELSADIYLMWDFDNLYFAARVYDDNLTFLQYQPGPYNGQDVVQIAFMPDGGTKGIYDFAISDANDVVGPYVYSRTEYSLAGAQLGGQILADGYIIEAAIPWSSFGGYSPTMGDAHLMGFILVDYNYGFSSSLMFDYGNNDQTDINETSGWNTLFLLGENDCGLWGLPQGDINMDCRTDLNDFAIIAAGWLECTDPANEDCVDLR